MIQRRQSKRMSLVESVTDKGIAAIIATLCAIWYFNFVMELQGVAEVTPESSVVFTVLMFIVAVIRGYFVRQLFDRLPVISRYIRRRFG